MVIMIGLSRKMRLQSQQSSMEKPRAQLIMYSSMMTAGLHGNSDKPESYPMIR